MFTQELKFILMPQLIVIYSVAISWGSKMNFSSCVNMSGFCSDNHKRFLLQQENLICFILGLAELIVILTA